MKWKMSQRKNDFKDKTLGGKEKKWWITKSLVLAMESLAFIYSFSNLVRKVGSWVFVESWWGELSYTGMRSVRLPIGVQCTMSTLFFGILWMKMKVQVTEENSWRKTILHIFYFSVMGHDACISCIWKGVLCEIQNSELMMTSWRRWWNKDSEQT
jgi:hypothetical protein